MRSCAQPRLRKTPLLEFHHAFSKQVDMTTLTIIIHEFPHGSELDLSFLFFPLTIIALLSCVLFLPTKLEMTLHISKNAPERAFQRDKKDERVENQSDKIDEKWVHLTRYPQRRLAQGSARTDEGTKNMPPHTPPPSSRWEDLDPPRRPPSPSAYPALERAKYAPYWERGSVVDEMDCWGSSSRKADGRDG